MENISEKRKTLLSIIGIMLLILFSVGVTFAFMSYTREGVRNNVINTGSVSFSFEESSYIWLQNATPIGVEEGCSLESNSGGLAMNSNQLDGGVAEFVVTSNSTTAVHYEIFIDPESLNAGDTLTSKSYDESGGNSGFSFTATAQSKMFSPFVIGLNLNTDTSSTLFESTGISGQNYTEAMNLDGNHSDNYFIPSFNANAREVEANCDIIRQAVDRLGLTIGYHFPKATAEQYLFNPLVYTPYMEFYTKPHDALVGMNLSLIELMSSSSTYRPYEWNSPITNANYNNYVLNFGDTQMEEYMDYFYDNIIPTMNINTDEEFFDAVRQYFSSIGIDPKGLSDERPYLADIENIEFNNNIKLSDVAYNNNLNHEVRYPRYFRLMDLERVDTKTMSYKLGDGYISGNATNKNRYFKLRMWLSDQYVQVADERYINFIDYPTGTEDFGHFSSDLTYEDYLDRYNEALTTPNSLLYGKFPYVYDSDELIDTYYNASMPHGFTTSPYQSIFDNKYTHTVFYLERSNFADVISEEEEYETVQINGFNFIKLKNEYYNKWEEELVYAYTPGMWKNMYYSMKIRVEASA